jgi:hypothetical protein
MLYRAYFGLGIWFSVLFLLYCGNSAPESETRVVAEATYQLSGRDSVIFANQNCEPGLECTYARYTWPVFNAGVTSTLLSLYNQPEFELGGDVATVDSIQLEARRFVDSYQSFREEFPESEQIWFRDSWTNVLHVSDSLLVLQAHRNEFTGGAHEMRRRRILNFDKNGRLVALSWLLGGEASANLPAQLEKAFREKYEITEETKLEDVGVTDGKIPFTENGTVIGDTVYVHFDPYEIAPWSMGDIDLKVPVSSLKP